LEFKTKIEKRNISPPEQEPARLCGQTGSTPETIGSEVVRKPEGKNVEYRMMNNEYRNEEESRTRKPEVGRKSSEISDQSQFVVTVCRHSAQCSVFDALCADDSTFFMDNSTISMDSSITFMDNSIMIMDVSIMFVDNSTMIKDMSITFVDSSTISVDKSMQYVDKSMITMDSSRGSTEEKNIECRMINAEYRREVDSVQSARLVKRTGAQSQYSVAVISTTSCHLEGRMTERSVTLELDSNGFSSLPPHPSADGFPLLKKEGKRSCYRLCCVFQKLELENEHFSSLRRSTPDTIGREVVLKPEARSLRLEAFLLTTKYNNSPSRRVRSKHKNAHLSVLNQEVGIREPKISAFFHILAMSRNVLPLGGGVRRQTDRGVWGSTNTLKRKHAYET